MSTKKTLKAKTVPASGTAKKQLAKAGPTQPRVGQAMRATNAAQNSKNINKDLKEIKADLKRDLRLSKVQDHRGTMRLVQHVPDCTTHYVSARLYPFQTLPGACLPQSDFTFASAKLKVTIAGTMVVGTGGVGYVVFAPKWGNDSGGVVCTTGSSAGGTGTALSAFTNLATSNFPELPYSAASFGDNLSGRYLAGGIRAAYAGKLMDQNGTMFAYCDPDHSSVSGNTPAQLMNLSQTRRRTVTGNVGPGENWVLQAIDNGPVIPDEVAFKKAAQVWADPYMVLIVFGTAGDQYYIEVAMHVEFIGRVVPNETPSHVDPENFPVVDQVIKETFETGPPQIEDSKGILQRIGEGISNMLPRIMSTVTGFKALPPIIDGLMKAVPLTGSNPFTSSLNGFNHNQLMSYDAVKQRQEKIDSGLGRGSNLWLSPEERFLKELLSKLVEMGISVDDFLSCCIPREPPAEKRKSLPWGKSPQSL